MMRIRAVIFDLDGTLSDSRELIYHAFERVLAAHDVRGVTREHMAAVIGKPVYAMYAELAPGHDMHELEHEHFADQDEHRDLIRTYDYLHETLDSLKRQGLRLGVFTGAAEAAYDSLREHNILAYFDSIVDATRYRHPKPNPEGLLLCMRDLQVLPQETVYVGDSVTDMQAGKAAGVRYTVGITHGFGRPEHLRAAGADELVADLSAVIQLIKRSV